MNKRRTGSSPIHHRSDATVTVRQLTELESSIFAYSHEAPLNTDPSSMNSPNNKRIFIPHSTRFNSDLSHSDTSRHVETARVCDLDAASSQLLRLHLGKLVRERGRHLTLWVRRSRRVGRGRI